MSQFDWTADWDDVLRRSGYSRSRSRRAAAIAAVAAAAVVLALPGIGIGGGLNAWISGSKPGIQLRARLTLAGGASVGTLSVRASRIFVSVLPRTIFYARGHNPALPPVPIRWSLDLAAGKTVGSVVLEDVRGKAIVRLCAPCSAGAHGTVKLQPRTFLRAFHGQVVAATSAGTARGVLDLPAGTVNPPVPGG